MTLDFAPEAFFFDMDGLLLDTERAGSVAFVEIAQPFGVATAAAEAFYASLVGTSSAVTRERVIEFIPGLDIDGFLADWVSAFDRRLEGEVPVKATVRETLGALSMKEHRLAVVTSTRGMRAQAQLDRAGLLGHFETVVGGDQVAANKPHPEPYLTAAKRLGVDPGRCVAFEDSDHGVASAVAAGCVVVQIPDVRPMDRPLPDLGQHIARDLAGAVRLLGLGA